MYIRFLPSSSKKSLPAELVVSDVLALLASYMVTPFNWNSIDHGAAVDDDHDNDHDNDNEHDNDHDNEHDNNENESDDNDPDYAFHMITSHNYYIYISILICYPSLPVLNIMFQQMRFMLHQTVQAPLESSDTSSSSTSYGSDGP